MNNIEAEWVFEGPDPEVGIFGDLVLHTCMDNVDQEPALIIDQRLYDEIHNDIVVEVTTHQCQSCPATTTTTEQWPRSFFAEPGQ